MLVMAVRMCFHSGRLGQKFFQNLDQLFEFGVAGEEFLDLGTNIRTFAAGLLVGKYVVVVLHDVFEDPWPDHTIGESPLRVHACSMFAKSKTAANP